MHLHHWHAQFDESIFPYTGVTSSSDLATIAFTTFDDQGTPSMPTVPNINNNSSSVVVPSTTSSPCKLCATLPLPVPQHQPVATAAPFQLPPEQPIIGPTPFTTTSVSMHPMVTRLRDGISKKKHFADLASLGNTCLISTLFSSTVPKGFKSASKHP